MIEDNENEKDREVEFSNFINCCADTLHYALHISNSKWEESSEQEIQDEILKLVNDVIMSVIGNRTLDKTDFDKNDYDLMFVATLRKALALIENI